MKPITHISILAIIIHQDFVGIYLLLKVGGMASLSPTSCIIFGPHVRRLPYLDSLSNLIGSYSCKLAIPIMIVYTYMEDYPKMRIGQSK